MTRAPGGLGSCRGAVLARILGVELKLDGSYVILVRALLVLFLRRHAN